MRRGHEEGHEEGHEGHEGYEGVVERKDSCIE